MDAAQDDCTWSPAHRPIFYTARQQSDGLGVRGDQGELSGLGRLEGREEHCVGAAQVLRELVETVKSGLIEIS